MATYDGMEFPLKLKTLLSRHRVSQEELARRLGVSQNKVSIWSRGKNMPDLKEAASIASVFGVSLAYLADDSQEEPPPTSELSEDERMVLRTFRAIAERKGMTAEDAILRLTSEEISRKQEVITKEPPTQGSPERVPIVGQPTGQGKARRKGAAG